MDSPAFNDQQLLKAYRDGDMQALGTLYSRYSALVFGVCLKYLRDRHASEDAVMAIFEHLVTKLRQHEVSNFKSWLHIVAKNYCLQELRKKKVHLLSPEDPGFMHLVSESHLEDMELLENKEAMLRECIAKLSEDQRTVVEQFYFGGVSYQGISESLGVGTDTVRSRIQNGRRNLRKCMNAINSES